MERSTSIAKVRVIGKCSSDGKAILIAVSRCGAEPHAVLGIRIGERIIHLLGEDMATIVYPIRSVRSP